MNAKRTASVSKIKGILDRALGKECWHVTAGIPTLPEFSLALGRKFKREVPLRNLQQSKVFRYHEGEISIFVRTGWRLQLGTAVIAGSDDESLELERALSRVVGRKLVGLTVEAPAWDLSLEFAGGLILKVFCERAAQRSVSRRNWHARIGKTRIYAGPGTRLDFSK